jgi:DNA-binding transcriptional MocR family regulator
VAPGRFRARVEFLKFVNTCGTASQPQMAIAEFLKNGGYDHHLRKMRRFYATQMLRMTEAVTRYFPKETRLTRPTGGMCLWLELPAHVDALKLYHQAMARRISIAPGPIFSAKQRFSNFIRLNCGNPWSESIEKALATLGELIDAMDTNGAPRRPAG